ncbi:MurR/RpiR family transcriptional regulator [Clostridium sp. CF011]|uniref:MurR/RpiR family transcriptional regulator n=1 Tax=Clostridium sp. CF011 TaxID=2843318 RepID=UPI001C0B57D0|nr:MurR/RpiR family transcriptional regulator [Clostridium sp. CF011]MBU3092325.1 MurR/RpiR family transcriptional regulator [Clostridium sp. CF011]WAG71421.1 MurR/RpiR family transcriptional regulator [Clostridium sp. CF011]
MRKKLFLKKILANIDEDINDSEYNVLKDLIDRIENIQKYSIREAAKNNFISTASISRLCYKFGLSGYSELKFYLKSEYDKFLPDNNQNRETLKDKVYSVLEEFNHNYKKSVEDIYDDDLNKFLALICESRGILVCGNGLSEIMAMYFSQRFQMVGKKVNFLSLNYPSEMYVNQLKENESLVIFSKSGEMQNLQNKIQIAKENNIKIILFTSKRNSDIGKCSDIVIKIYGNKNSKSYNSNVFMFIDILIDLFLGRVET